MPSKTITMTAQEKRSMENAYYLEHPVLHYSFNQRLQISFENKGCDEYDITLIQITEADKYHYSQNTDLSFKEITNNIGRFYYPLYFSQAVSEDKFNDEQWSNVMILHSKYVHINKDGKYYIHVLIQNNTCLELYLQILSELYEMVDIDYTKKVIEKCNKELYDYMNIDYTLSKLYEIGFMPKTKVIPSVYTTNIINEEKASIVIDTNADTIDAEITPAEFAELEIVDKTINITAKQIGKATLTIKATADNCLESIAYVALNITEKPLTKLTANVDSITLGVDTQTDIRLFTNATPKGTIEPQDMATMEQNKDNENIFTITGKEHGEFTITFKAQQTGYLENTLVIKGKVLAPTDLEIEKDTISMYEEESDTITITTPADTFSATAETQDIVSIEKLDNMIKIVGIGAGNTKVIIKAKEGDKIETIKYIDVEIKEQPPTELELLDNDIEMFMGVTKEVQVETEADSISVVDNNPNIATSQVNGKTITITTLAQGDGHEATFDVKAKVKLKKETIKTLNVTATEVETTLEIAQSDIEITNLQSETITATTNGVITATPQDSEVVKAEVQDKDIIITALKVGNTTIDVESLAEFGITKKTATINVVVNEVETILTTDKDKVTLVYTGNSDTIEVTTNADTYNAIIEDDSFATIDVKDNIITATPIALGSTNIVLDALANGSVNKKTLTLPVSVVSPETKLTTTMPKVTAYYNKSAVTIPIETNAEAITATLSNSKMGSIKVDGKNIIFTPTAITTNSQATSIGIDGSNYVNASSGNIVVKTVSDIYPEKSLTIPATTSRSGGSFDINDIRVNGVGHNNQMFNVKRSNTINVTSVNNKDSYIILEVQYATNNVSDCRSLPITKTSDTSFTYTTSANYLIITFMGKNACQTYPLMIIFQ